MKGKRFTMFFVASSILGGVLVLFTRDCRKAELVQEVNYSHLGWWDDIDIASQIIKSLEENKIYYSYQHDLICVIHVDDRKLEEARRMINQNRIWREAEVKSRDYPNVINRETESFPENLPE